MSNGFYETTYFSSPENGGYVDYLGDEATHRRNARRHLKHLAEFGHIGSQNLIEVGCAAGFLLDEARRKGWLPVGADVSATMRTEALRRFNLHIEESVDQITLEPESAGAVIAVQVLEHMLNPFDALVASHRLLRHGGTLLIETWDLGSPIARLMGSRWQEINPPSVLWLWNRRHLASMVRRAGFRDVVLRSAHKWVSLRTALGHLGRHRLVGSSLGRLSLPYVLGDLVVLTASK